MRSNDFFFSCAIDLKGLPFPDYAESAMYTIYEACESIDRPDKYGTSVEVIMIRAIFQNYDSKFLRPSIRYYRKRKTIGGSVKIDVDKVLQSDFTGTVDLYHQLILHVLDTVKDRVPDYDFDRLKEDLQQAIQAELEVVE